MEEWTPCNEHPNTNKKFFRCLSIHNLHPLAWPHHINGNLFTDKYVILTWPMPSSQDQKIEWSIYMNQMLIVCLLKNQWDIAMWLLAINFKRSTKWKIIFFQKTLKKVINLIPFQDKNIFEKQNQKLWLLNLAQLVSIPAVM